MSPASGYKVRINTHTEDTNAVILITDGVLIGVVSELLDGCHGPDRGKWTIEFAFGLDDGLTRPMFESAGDAANWLGARCGGATFYLDGVLPELR